MQSSESPAVAVAPYQRASTGIEAGSNTGRREVFERSVLHRLPLLASAVCNIVILRLAAWELDLAILLLVFLLLDLAWQIPRPLVVSGPDAIVFRPELLSRKRTLRYEEIVDWGRTSTLFGFQLATGRRRYLPVLLLRKSERERFFEHLDSLSLRRRATTLDLVLERITFVQRSIQFVVITFGALLIAWIVMRTIVGPT